MLKETERGRPKLVMKYEKEGDAINREIEINLKDPDWLKKVQEGSDPTSLKLLSAGTNRKQWKLSKKSHTSLKKIDPHINGIIDVIEQHRVYGFQDIFVYYKKISMSGAVQAGYHNVPEIGMALFRNRRESVMKLLNQWVDSPIPLLQVAAMRILCSTEEHRALVGNPDRNRALKESEDKIEIPQITFSDGTTNS